MIRLLVSVRSASEALAALVGGADLVDIKEPSRGSLGAADSKTWQEIAAVVGTRCPLSVAMGELSEPLPMPPVEHWTGITLAKAGPAGTDVEWPRLWDDWRHELPATVQPVAVAYADWEVAHAPQPPAIMHHAAATGCSWVLIDTWQKDGRSLLQMIPTAELAAWLRLASELRLQLVLAGSLRRDEIAIIRDWQPTAIAVRGAVCRGTRTGNVDAQLVAELASIVKQSYFTSTFTPVIVP